MRKEKRVGMKKKSCGQRKVGTNNQIGDEKTQWGQTNMLGMIGQGF